MSSAEAPRLYGLTDKNCSRKGKKLWGKNQFNSAFPLALCLYMRDKGINPVAVTSQKGGIKAAEGTWKMADVVGEASTEPFYGFESSFEGYSEFSRNQKDKIDLVVSCGGEEVRPLEIKLTVVPDSGTSEKGEDRWAPEIVLRPVTSAYAMMGVAKSLNQDKNRDLKAAIVKVLRKVYNPLSSSWSEAAVMRHEDKICSALNETVIIAKDLQSPFLIQPIWRTQGQSFDLAKNCFDVFIWSDIAIMQIPILEHKSSGGKKITRGLREIARHVRALYDILQTEDYDYKDIYKGMAMGMQTDKAFTLNGTRSIAYLQHKRLTTPILKCGTLAKLILGAGENELKPERRFDAAAQLHMRKILNEQQS